MVTEYTVTDPDLVKQKLKISTSPVKLEVEDLDTNQEARSVKIVPPAPEVRTQVVDKSIIEELLKKQAITND
jgi:hypothetical protein